MVIQIKDIIELNRLFHWRQINVSEAEISMKSLWFNVPEVLNVHMNESEKKSIFCRRIFFSSSEKLIFEKENVIFFNTYFNFNLFYFIVVSFL